MGVENFFEKSEVFLDEVRKNSLHLHVIGIRVEMADEIPIAKALALKNSLSQAIANPPLF